jgi:hypothetical protein
LGGKYLYLKEVKAADTVLWLIRNFLIIDSNSFFFSRSGFSAAISMIIVSSISLATMLSNNLLIPYGFVGSLENLSQEKTANVL